MLYFVTHAIVLIVGCWAISKATEGTSSEASIIAGMATIAWLVLNFCIFIGVALWWLWGRAA